MKKNRMMHACLLNDIGMNIIFDFFSLVDAAAAAADNTSRISPENNLDFYSYSQTTPYSVMLIFRR